MKHQLLLARIAAMRLLSLVNFPGLLSESGLSLDRLQSFCRVAEAGGVTKAAQGDAARQSQFSRQIKELEAFFRVELIRRSGRGVALTEAGRRLHALAREQFAALGDFKGDCAAEPARITIAAGDSLLQWLLLPRLDSLRAQLPDVTFRLLNLPTAEIAGGLADGVLDFGLLRADAVTGSLQPSPLGRLGFSLFVPAQLLPAGTKRVLSANELRRLPLATLEGEGVFRRELERLAKQAKAPFEVQLEVSSFLLAARAVRTGGWAAVLPGVAREEFRGVDVTEHSPAWLKPLGREMGLVWNPRLAAVRPALAKVVPALTQLCRTGIAAR